MKKSPMKRDAYRKEWNSRIERYRQVQRDPLRLKFHLQPPMGWLNDPNGLCQKDGIYHIYFQYCPFYPVRGSIFWGHMTTRDFIRYEKQEPVLYPDSPWDANGPYSGSAYQEDGTLYVFYTGNVRYEDGDYDYVNSGREQNTILTVSRDGFCFSEKRLLMKNEDYPADLTKHVRDPQVFREKGRYFMIQGARDRENRGSILLFESGNLTDWTYRLRFQPEKAFGYMWECPNYLKIEGKRFLIACPQGVPCHGYDFANVYQCGWFSLDYDFEGTDYKLGTFHQLDRGFDFYAPQVFCDERGRWLLFGWMAVPDSGYGEPTLENGWIYALTIPRELYVNGEGRLCQRPAEELRGLQRDGREETFEGSFSWETSPCFELKLEMERETADFRLFLRESAFLEYGDGTLTLDMTGCGSGREKRCLEVSGIRNLWIFSDTSSLEIFVNDGEEAFTTRIYDSMEGLRVRMESGEAAGRAQYYRLDTE